MSSERQQIASAIAALEAQRATLGDAALATALAALRANLAEIDAAAQPEQTLRQVTVLFLDVVGSTALAQRLDAEDMHAVIDGVLARCTAIVQAHQGKVLQYAGDSLLGAFGAEGAREDDAERAVHAGLALLAEGRRSAEQLAQAHGHTGFDVRVGLHTGQVLLGGGVDAEHNIRGHTVHVAARMEQSAPAGGLRISHDTYRHVRGVFDVEAQPPLPLKGLDAPLATYLVQRAKPRAFRVATRGIEGVETRMIGRDAELEQLQDAFQRVYREGKLVNVLVVAEAGLGKSRLLYEFENWAEARPETFFIFQGRAHPQTRVQPYGLLRDVLAWRLQIAEGDSTEVAKRKFEQGVSRLFEPDGSAETGCHHAHVLGHLIGLDFTQSPHVKDIGNDTRQLRHRGFHAAAQLFRRIAANNATPIVLVLDDLHYADEGSLDFLDHVVQENHDVPMLVLGLGRPELLERRGGSTGLAVRQVALGPLDTLASRSLVDELLKKLDGVPLTLHQLITGTAQGNPFYMEELIKMLIDEGAIRTDPEAWSVNADRLTTTRIPQTLTGVLQARLDGLEPAQKRALQYASVIGHQFWEQALASLDARAIDSLAALTRRELIVPHPDADSAGARQFAFKHQLLHQVTYETVLKSERRELHGRVADWMAGAVGSTAGEFPGAIAEHYEHAGNKTLASEFFARAAENAASRFAHESVKNSVARALLLIDEGNEPNDAVRASGLRLRWRLLSARERTLELQGLRVEQQLDVAALEELAEALRDDQLRAEAAWRRCDIALRLSDFQTQQVAAREAMTLASRIGDRSLALRAQQRLVVALGYLGDTDTGKTLGIEGLAAARALGDAQLESLHLGALSLIAVLQDDLQLALELDEQKLQAARRVGDRRGESMAVLSLANSWLGLGAHAQAERLVDEAWRLHRSLGDRGAEAYLLNYRSLLALRQGDAASAQHHAKAALQIALDISDRQSEAYSLFRLGDAELMLQDHEAATSAFERARSVAAAIGSTLQLDASGGLARAALARGDLANASLVVDGLLEHKASTGSFASTEAPYLIQLCCWQVLACVGDARAAELLDATYGELQAKAKTIGDEPLRNAYLNDIPEHREIAAAWFAQQAARAGA